MTEVVGSSDNNQLENITKRSDVSDGDTEKTSATLFRIQRKQDNRSTSKHPSRKSSESPDSSLSLNKFYTKMTGKNNVQCPEVHREPKFVRKDTQPVKRRSPTPLPGYHPRSQNKAENNESRRDVERELELGELEKKVEDQRIRKVAAERRAQLFESEVREKLRVIKELEGMLVQQRRESQKESAEQGARDRKENSCISSSNLKMLRNNIAQFRMKELEDDNVSLMRKNSELRMQIDRLKIENEGYRHEAEALKSQILLLSQKTGAAKLQSQQREIEHLRQRITQSSTHREVTLDALLVESQRNNLVLKNSITHLEMKMALVSRRKNEEIEKIINQKNKELSSLRRKLFAMANQMLEAKEEETNKKRSCPLSNTGSRARIDSECSFSLSPDS